MTDVALVALAVLAGSLVKGVTGLGLPPVALAVLAPILGGEHAVVVLSLPTVVSNGWLVWANREGLRDADHLPLMVAAGIVGAFLGSRLLAGLDEAAVALVLGTVVFAYALFHLLRPRVALSPTASRRLSGPVGLAGGLLQGATGLSSPVLATYLHARRLPPAVFLASISLLFQVFALAQFTGLVTYGLLDATRLLHGGVAVLAVSLGIPLGLRLGRRLPRRAFERATLAVLVLSTAALVLEGLDLRPW